MKTSVYNPLSLGVWPFTLRFVLPRCWVGYPKATGPTVLPGCPHSLPHAPPRMPRYSVRAPFSLQTPVERSERVAGCWAVRARANPLSLGVWHFTLRFVLPRSWVGYPRRRPKGCGMQSPSGPKVYPRGFTTSVVLTRLNLAQGDCLVGIAPGSCVGNGVRSLHLA